ncbi:MAG: rRNA maturation RNase YbeY [Acidobacteriota bacterium]
MVRGELESGSHRRGRAASSAQKLIGTGRPKMQVRNLQRRVKVDGRRLKSFLQRVGTQVGREDSFATLVLVGDSRMRELNRDFRSHDRATDVLSFPSGKPFAPEDGRYLGDIVISVETAQRQALRKRSSLSRELDILALHGFLHLLGYDHETDGGEMRRLEYRLRRQSGITRPRTAQTRRQRK